MIIIDIIKIIIPIISIVGILLKPIKKILKSIDTNNEAVGILLRERLMSYYDDYMEKGYISTKDLGYFTNACEQYWEFGFNHFSRELLEDIKNLKSKGK